MTQSAPGGTVGASQAAKVAGATCHSAAAAIDRAGPVAPEVSACRDANLNGQAVAELARSALDQPAPSAKANLASMAERYGSSLKTCRSLIGEA